MSSAFWSDARASMLLDPGVTNLNTGSFGPLPRVVFERVTALRQRLAEEPMDFLLRGAAAACGRPANGWPASSAAIRGGSSSPPTSPPPSTSSPPRCAWRPPAKSC